VTAREVGAAAAASLEPELAAAAAAAGLAAAVAQETSVVHGGIAISSLPAKQDRFNTTYAPTGDLCEGFPAFSAGPTRHLFLPPNGARRSTSGASATHPSTPRSSPISRRSLRRAAPCQPARGPGRSTTARSESTPRWRPARSPRGAGPARASRVCANTRDCCAARHISPGHAFLPKKVLHGPCDGH
jgi:hypothetical protein